MVTKIESGRRDAEATRARLVEAAAAILAQTGIEGLGVNALAQAAGVDKVLIYRYFGGMDGVFDALGGKIDLWIGEALAQTQPPGGSYSEAMTVLLIAYLRALRGNPALRSLLLTQSGPAADRLADARSKAIGRWFASVRDKAGDPAPGVDAPAVNAILLAAVQQLALREAMGEANGLDLADEKTWARIEAALAALLDAVHPNTA